MSANRWGQVAVKIHGETYPVDDEWIKAIESAAQIPEGYSLRLDLEREPWLDPEGA